MCKSPFQQSSDVIQSNFHFFCDFAKINTDSKHWIAKSAYLCAMQRDIIISFVRQHTRVLVWSSLFILFVITSSRHLGFLTALASSVCTILPMILLTIVMEALILPQLLRKRRVLVFFLSALAIGILVFLATHCDIFIFSLIRQFAPETPTRKVDEMANSLDSRFYINAKYSILLLATSAVASITFLVNQRKNDERQFEEEQIQNRLKYLRAQINPHFLFNALNCIYALSVTQDEKAPDSVLKLSEMLRYVIDDCRADQVLLSKEVNYIRNYIDFQRIRMEREPDLTFECTQQDANYMVPPMVLQPMIENCFKHSRLVDDPNAYVHITLRQDATGLLFTTENSIPADGQLPPHSDTERSDQERTGIGLDNVKQRLKMLFGEDKCSFKIIEDEQRYKTVLHIS